MPLSDTLSNNTWGRRRNTFRPLNASLSRFSPNDTLERIAQANASYEYYFQNCAPKQCSFTYYYYRFVSLDVVTTFLSVFLSHIRFEIDVVLHHFNNTYILLLLFI